MLVPWTGMDLSQPALESKVLTTGHQGSFPYFILFIHKQTNKQKTKQKTLLKEGLNNVNTRPPYLSPEKSLYRPRSNSWNQAWNNGLVKNCERDTTGYILSSCLLNLYAQYIMQNIRLGYS